MQMYEGDPRSELHSASTCTHSQPDERSAETNPSVYTICNYMRQVVNTAHLTSRIRSCLASSTQGAVAAKLVVHIPKVPILTEVRHLRQRFGRVGWYPVSLQISRH